MGKCSKPVASLNHLQPIIDKSGLMDDFPPFPDPQPADEAGMPIDDFPPFRDCQSGIPTFEGTFY